MKKVNGEENIRGMSDEELRVENKPSKTKPNKFEVGQMRIMTISAVSSPGEDADSEVCYLPVGGKADEWIDESTVAMMMPLDADVACFVSGYKAGFLEGFEAAQKKDQKYLMDFMEHFIGIKEDTEDEAREDGDA